MGLHLFFFASSWALGSWTYGHLAVHVLTPSFHISGFYLLFYLHQRGESVLTWFCVCFGIWCGVRAQQYPTVIWLIELSLHLQIV